MRISDRNQGENMEHESYGMMIFRDKEAEEQFKNASPSVKCAIADILSQNIADTIAKINRERENEKQS